MKTSRYTEAQILAILRQAEGGKSWLGMSEQLRAIDKWYPARFLVSV